MTLCKDQKDKLKEFGFKSRGMNSYSYISSANQFIRINMLEDNFQLVIDGTRIYGTNLSFENILKIITILFKHESRKRI